MRKVWLASFVTLALAGHGCTSATPPNQFGVGGSGSGSGGESGAGGDVLAGVGGSGFTTGTDGSTGVTGGGGNNCSEAAKLIYVLSTDNVLYSFSPQQKAFKEIGPLGCKTTMSPNSMAVDRNAVAYVNYVESDQFAGDTDGAIFKVSTVDASCEATPIKLGAGWFRLGMGFSTDAAQGTSEQLFVTGTGNTPGETSPGLGRIDFGANKIVPLGQFNGPLAGKNAELTGTGDARLFGFFTTSPVEVAEIDKKGGAILSTAKLPKVETPSAWAFSFWGGDFYLYTAPNPSTNPGRTTNVSKYHPQDGSTDAAYMTNIGFTIVGAGVSTCAPVEPPK